MLLVAMGRLECILQTYINILQKVVGTNARKDIHAVVNKIQSGEKRMKLFTGITILQKL
jgi:hypothetical protein